MTSPSETDLEFEMIDEPDMTVPIDTLVPAILVDLKKVTFDFTDRKTGEKKQGDNLEWWFEIQAPSDYAGRKIRGRTRTKLSSNTRGNMFKPWAETLLGREIEIGARIHRDDLVGTRCEITVRHEPDKKDPSKFYEAVDEVIPIDSNFDFNDQPPF